MVKVIITTLFFLLALAIPSLSQTVKPNITDDEEREARALAVTFFNRFSETKDINPLFEEFFVSDFGRRLEFCRTTSNCEGFARDFWKYEEDHIKFKPSRNDFIRHYAAISNTFYLYFQSINSLAIKAKQKPEDFYETGVKIINGRLTKLLKRDAQIVFKDLFEDTGDNGLGGLKSIKAFRKRISNIEDFVLALRIVEKEIRDDLTSTGVNTFAPLKPEDFRVSDEVNTGRFFDYPVETKLIDVWDEGLFLPFKMDLIAEKGRLRIVAIYLPMD